MKAIIQPLAWGAVLALALTLASTLALELVIGTTQAAELQHSHGSPAAAAAVVPGTQKWATDAPLRQHMSAIRRAVEAAQDNPSQSPLDAAGARQLQQEVEANVARLIADCKLPPQADAALHGLLTELLGGAEALAVPASQTRGIHQLRAALARYPELFAAPLWSEPSNVPN